MRSKSVRGGHPLRTYSRPPELHVHPLKSPFGILSPIATQVTGQPWLKTRALGEALDDVDTDLFHFHNISLVGGPGVLGLGTNRPHRPDHDGPRILADLSDAPALEIRLQSLRLEKLRELLFERAQTAPGLAHHRAIERGLGQLDALVFPSRHALDEHRRRGIGEFVPLVHLPYFLPDQWSGGIENAPPERWNRPYLAAAGRLVKLKGFQRLIPLMRHLPEVDLRIAGTGPYAPSCELWRPTFPTCASRGSWAARPWPGSSAARAVVVPSLFPETFGYVVLEAFAMGTPVVVHEGGGALYETAVKTGGGLGYSCDVELLTALRRVVHDHDLRNELAARGYAMRMGEWSESEHIARYLELVALARSARGGSPLAGPHVRLGKPEFRKIPG